MNNNDNNNKSSEISKNNKQWVESFCKSLIILMEIYFFFFFGQMINERIMGIIALSEIRKCGISIWRRRLMFYLFSEGETQIMFDWYSVSIIWMNIRFISAFTTETVFFFFVSKPVIFFFHSSLLFFWIIKHFWPK